MKSTKATKFLIAHVIFVALMACSSLGINSLSTPTIVPAVRHTVTDPVSMDLIWVAEEVYIHRNDQDNALDSAHGKTCFLGNVYERRQYLDDLNCLDSQNGNILWSFNSGTHDEIAVTPNGIFVTYIGPASVRKYDFQDGDLVWRSNELGGRMGSSYLYSEDGQIEVLFLHERTVLVSANDGKVLRTIANQSVYVSEHDEILIDFDGLTSRKTSTNDIIWEYPDTNIYPAPLFTGDKIFVRRGFSDTAYALDRRSGTLLWETPKVLTNFAYSPNKHVVYALREGGELLAIDENSGKESLVAVFSPAPFRLSDGNNDFSYELSYDEKEQVLVVYTGDSSQLFALREQ